MQSFDPLVEREGNSVDNVEKCYLSLSQMTLLLSTVSIFQPFCSMSYSFNIFVLINPCFRIKRGTTLD